MQPPWGLRALSRELRDAAANVPGIQVDEGNEISRAHRLRRIRDDGVVSPVAHVLQHATYVLRHEVGLECPGGVRVADGEREVGHPREHHPLVGESCRHIDGSTVDDQCHPSHREDVQPGGAHDDVSVKCHSRCQFDPRGRQRADGVGDDVCATAADRPEKVCVRDYAQALVPRVIRRGQVLVVVEALGQRRESGLAQDRLHGAGVTAAQLVREHRIADVLGAHEPVGELRGQQATDPVCMPVAGCHGGNVRR